MSVTVQQPVIATTVKGGEFGALYWLSDAGVLKLANDATPLPVAATLSGTSAMNLTQVGGAAIALGQALAAASLPVVLTAAQIAAITPQGYSSSIGITRPSDTTPYTAGDVVGATAAAITFTSIGPASGIINLNDADLRIDLSAVPSGMTSFRLHLYSATPPSALADNAPWDLPSGDRSVYLGYVDLGTPVDVGSTLFVQTGGSGPGGFKQIAMGATTSLFGYLVTNGGYTPTSAATLNVRLNARGL